MQLPYWQGKIYKGRQHQYIKTERAGVAARAHGSAVAHGQLRKLPLGKRRVPHATGKWG